MVFKHLSIIHLLVIILCSVTGASVQPESEFLKDDARFYATVASDLNQDGLTEIIAVGQINRFDEQKFSALIVLLALKDNTMHKFSELSFNVVHKGQHLPTRIRAAKILQHQNKDSFTLITAGRGGENGQKIGFLHRALIENNKLIDKGYQIFVIPDAEATHGYSLDTGDIDGDGEPEIIYGGFSINNGQEKADVQVFEIKNGEFRLKSRPFEHLKIPLRVNALETVDVDNDGKSEIIIAGRTKKSKDLERSAFAWWSDGKISIHVFEEEFPSRLRALMTVDANNDGKKDLLTAGRIESGNLWLADLRLWALQEGVAMQRDRFCWSLGRQIRLRTLSAIKSKPAHFHVGGRAEWSNLQGAAKWLGFIWEFSVKQGHLQPVYSPIYIEEGIETRVRHLHLSETGNTIVCGFSKMEKNKDQGFVRILRSI